MGSQSDWIYCARHRALEIRIRNAVVRLDQHGHDPDLPDPECPVCGVLDDLRRALERDDGEDSYDGPF